MDFDQLAKDLQNHLNKNIFNSKYLYETLSDDKNLLWELYLQSFPPGTNPVYKEKTEHDCNNCKSFIRKFASVVAINNNNELVSIWDFRTKSGYQPIIDELAKTVKSFPIKNFYFSKEQEIGIKRSFYVSEKSFPHFYTILPHNHNCLRQDSRESLETINGKLCTNKIVFKNSLEAISAEAIEIVLELIAQNSLYRGTEKKYAVTEFQKYHSQYHALTDEAHKDNYCWKNCGDAEHVVSIKNHSIGVLLVDISEGLDLEDALKKYDSIMAPYNYKRPKAVFTKKMVEDAKQKIIELGLENSLQRRCATIDDMDVNNVLFLDRNNADNKNEVDIFDDLSKSAKTNVKTYKNLQEISIENFISNVLPTAKEIKILLENNHKQNLVSLITSEESGVKPLFMWDNTFSWAYNNNVADSFKENVKKAGGKVEGVLRCSLMWNDDERAPNLSDLDLHCIEKCPALFKLDNEIYFGRKNSPTSGNLDVDITYPQGVAIENIIYQQLPTGTYTFFVHNFQKRENASGFKVEIEFDSQIYSYVYPEPLGYSKDIIIAKISHIDGKTTITHLLEPISSGKHSLDFWNLKTNEMHPVSVVCLSPNYWGDKQMGNKHYFFMLKDCVADCELNGFFNEFLHKDLHEHRKVFELLGSKMKVSNPSIGNQLSGLGFSSTQKAGFVCEVTTNNLKKVLKVIIQ